MYVGLSTNQGFGHILCVLDVFRSIYNYLILDLYLIYSKWLWCRQMKSTTAEETVKTLQEIFHDMEELPECIVCDSGM